MNSVELERMLSVYIRDAAPCENRIEAKNRMMQCLESQTPHRTLNLENLGLIALPEDLSFLNGIHEIRLANNRLERLPESICSIASLVILRSNDNVLVQLPEAFGNLQSLRQAWLNDNNLTELPRSLAHLRHRCYVNLNANLLPQTVRQQLHHAIVALHAQNPQQGPQIYHDMALENQMVTVLPLKEEIDSWRVEAGLSGRYSQAVDLSQAIEFLPAPAASALSSQLARMRATAHYTKAPQNLVARVNDVLDYMHNNVDVLHTCAAVAVEGTETCDDRIALAFIELEEAIVHHRSAKLSLDLDSRRDVNTLQNLITTAKGLHKSQLLKEIAQKKIGTLVGFVDHTEIILKYVVKLSTELNLPSQLNEMIFQRCALQVTGADIDRARHQIQELATDENLNKYLAAWEPWKHAMAKYCPLEYTEAVAKASAEKAMLFEEVAALAEQLADTEARYGKLSEQYLGVVTANNEANAKYRSLEISELSALTSKVRQQIAQHSPNQSLV
ncbi:NEL-type E3 ubiquitin ligase domain-containing protein [Limnobacter parvus]|uniref:NEL domain-containing protein n=1 Tax=Limnobacter parvus TaxID=2939690 RepID=A0ABT1XIA5_9BURK|nr:NEL-type E3 ubiquitin ligase domain-containing protein [Limnobacter parvus]MCR2747007.1 hypothetical protein [Limnobacter parvus]